MKPIEVAVIGTGWCGGIRAETLAAHPLVKALHLAETNAVRLSELSKKTKARSCASPITRSCLKKTDIEAVYISATPETTHYPMARDCLAAGKHVFLEKPIAMTLEEADELIELKNRKNLKFSIGYSQRFNPKFAYVRQCIRDGTIGRPVSALVSRHITRSLGKKISGRVKLSPAAMESTHDLDFLLWCLEPAKPVRVYSQQNYGVMKETSGNDIPDTQWITVTLDSGLTLRGRRRLEPAARLSRTSPPPGSRWSAPRARCSWMTRHRDVVVNTVKKGMQLPMSTMPGEFVEHTYAGAMAPETVHFLEAVVYDRPVLVTPEHARMVMEVYIAADLSAERNAAVDLPCEKPRSGSASRSSARAA